MTMTKRIDERIQVAKARTAEDGHRRVVYLRSFLGEISPSIASHRYYERNDGIHEVDLCATVSMSDGEVCVERHELDTFIPKGYRS